jgi:hypothetical protein
MKTRVIITFLLAAGAVLAGPRIAIGVGIGVPASPGYYVTPAPVYAGPAPVYGTPAPAYYAGAPMYPAPAYVAPAPGYTWVDGFWYISGGHRSWRPGYWAAPRAGFYVSGRWHRR